MVNNPVIRGFSPDPSIIRVGDVYYMAVSTFQWWPGIEIYESRDLENWKHTASPITRTSQANLRGVCDGGGIWAPCLSCDGEKIYLVYTLVMERGQMMQTDNYLITAQKPDGEWSEPKYLNSMGFDPSLFHDSDRKKYLLNLDNHYSERFNGLWLTELDAETCEAKGEPRKIYSQPDGELVEGAHIYHLNGYYYLLKAQGGTGSRHSAQLSRSKSIWGPYEDDKKILLHSRDNPKLYIQAAGHSDIVKTKSGWAMCHLGIRRGDGICGREACMENVVWTSDGWLRLAGGGENPSEKYESGLPKHKYDEEKRFCDFKKKELSREFKSLREPLETRFSERGLELRGGAGPISRFDQALLALRVTEEEFYSETKLAFEPRCEKELAGLIMYYDSRHWQFCCMTHSSAGFREVRLMVCDDGKIDIRKSEKYDGAEVVFGARLKDGIVTYSVNGVKFADADAKTISDTHISLGFTGAMSGICCVDMYKKERTAVFEYFKWGTGCCERDKGNMG